MNDRQNAPQSARFPSGSALSSQLGSPSLAMDSHGDRASESEESKGDSEALREQSVHFGHHLGNISLAAQRPATPPGLQKQRGIGDRNPLSLSKTEPFSGVELSDSSRKNGQSARLSLQRAIDPNLPPTKGAIAPKPDFSAPLVQRARNNQKLKKQKEERKQQEKTRMWATLLQQRGGDPNEVNLFATLATTSNRSFPEVEQLAKALPRLRSAAELVELARQLPALDIDGVLVLSRISGPSIPQLISIYQANGSSLNGLSQLITVATQRAANFDLLPGLLNQLGNDTMPAIGFLQQINDANHLSALLNQEADRRLLSQLLGLQPDGQCLSQLLNRVGDRQLLIRLMTLEKNGQTLLNLIQAVNTVADLENLLPVVGDRNLLIQFLQFEPDGARLTHLLFSVNNNLVTFRQLVQEIQNKHGDANLMNRLLAKVQNDGIVLLEFLQKITNANDLTFLLDSVADRRLLSRCLTLEANGALLTQLFNLLLAGDRQYLEEFLKLIANRAALTSLLQPINGITFYRPRLLKLVRALQADGLDGPRILNLLTQLTAAGKTQIEIEALLQKMRGTLDAPADNTLPEARSITDVPSLTVPPAPSPPAIPVPFAGPVGPLPAPGGFAPPRALSPQESAGKKGLSGVEIEQHLQDTTTAGRGVATIENTYPTGQDFTVRSDNQLWNDCIINGAGALFLPNVTHGQPGETPAQRQIRQKLALQELMRRYPASSRIIQEIFSHDEGATPRPFVSIAFEDSYNSNAHNVSRHVIGGAEMPNRESLALRAMYKVPPCGVKATAFNNIGEANGAIAPALNATILNPVNWPHYRSLLVQGALIPAIIHPSVAGLCLRKTDNPKNNPYPNPLPPPLNARPLIGPGPGGVAPLGLTHLHPITQVKVILRTADNPDAKGWGVYTAYPN